MVLIWFWKLHECSCFLYSHCSILFIHPLNPFIPFCSLSYWCRSHLLSWSFTEELKIFVFHEWLIFLEWQYPVCNFFIFLKYIFNLLFLVPHVAAKFFPSPYSPLCLKSAFGAFSTLYILLFCGFNMDNKINWFHKLNM